MLADASLEDKYRLGHGRVYLTGTQALVRLALAQAESDARSGLDTAGYISGYRGSPLGTFDQALARARPWLDRRRIVFQPGVNEDLAATAIWGTQQLDLSTPRRHDGVFALWYGKGPGVDRCGDVFRHANAAGTARHGGVLALAGDDHGAKSSTQAAQSDLIFKAVGIPILSPASVQEIIDYGLHGFALSRFSGCWVGFKCVTDVVESSASVEIDPDRVRPVMPADFVLPRGGLNIRWPEYLGFTEQEERLYHHKLPAVSAWMRANRLDRVVWAHRAGDPPARLGIVATGKAWNDLRQALDDLGIDESAARHLGIRLYKVAMPWPLEPEGIAEFAKGLEEILVVEEKRDLVEAQIRDRLYPLPEARRPRVTGKFDGTEAGRLLPSSGELSPEKVARVVAARLFHVLGGDIAAGLRERLRARLAHLDAREAALKTPATVIPIQRIPYFCAGCPHNTSTRVPEGSRALAGIGCHYMAQWMPGRNTATFSHMGGEGAAWCGQFPFSDEKHVFANIGDGTYYHSGLLAIRHAVAARAPITYKILYNDAVAMTGGQQVDGPLTVPMIVRQVLAEGVGRVVVVTDEPEKYAGAAPGAPVRHRDDLDAVQRELRDWSGGTADTPGNGVSVLVYDQTCAAEKRRRRKRGAFPDPDRRVFINEAVCEGCGDCGEQSNCVAIEPLETEFGRKRAINQSACNKDFSCVKGFCPSFVSVEGAKLRRGRAAAESAPPPVPPAPSLPSTRRPYGILVTGIGGTGVITIGQILGMAAHLEGKGVTVLDVTGLAQKNGAVMSHLRIADSAGDLHSARIALAGADAVIGCDLVVSSSAEALGRMDAGRTRAAVNGAEVPTADFTRNPDWQFPEKGMRQAIDAATGGGASFIDATRLATALMGDAIAANMFMLGHAWQRGLVPVSAAAILRAIELNAVAVDMNRRSFEWGRCAAHDLASVERAIHPAQDVRAGSAPANSLDEVIERRVTLLTDYQDARLAARYRALVERVRGAESKLGRAGTADLTLTEAVARNYAKLLAYKDEYEVARLHADPAFAHRLADTFEDGYRLRFHLAPPLLAKTDPVTGEPRKTTFGPWMLPLFRVLAKFKGLRGGALDPFGRTVERRMERQLIADYERTVEELLDGLTPGNHPLAVEIAVLPAEIRGFGHVKRKSVERAREREAALLAVWRAPHPAEARAA